MTKPYSWRNRVFLYLTKDNINTTQMGSIFFIQQLRSIPHFLPIVNSLMLQVCYSLKSSETLEKRRVMI